MDSYNDNDKEYYSAFGDNNADGQWSPYLLQGGQLKVSERGSVDQYDLAFGINISELVMLGATVAITDLNYRYQSSYDEEFTNGNNLYLDNYLDTVPLKSPTGASIATLRSANAVAPNVKLK